jgi:hypothetical protein
MGAFYLLVVLSLSSLTDHDNGKVEKSIEGFCASASLHAE